MNKKYIFMFAAYSLTMQAMQHEETIVNFFNIIKKLPSNTPITFAKQEFQETTKGPLNTSTHQTMYGYTLELSSDVAHKIPQFIIKSIKELTRNEIIEDFQLLKYSGGLLDIQQSQNNTLAISHLEISDLKIQLQELLYPEITHKLEELKILHNSNTDKLLQLNATINNNVANIITSIKRQDFTSKKTSLLQSCQNAFVTCGIGALTLLALKFGKLL
ncbi:MAG: hypothetical protein WA432_04100 [Candidatus Babeliaceae bacterium]